MLPSELLRTRTSGRMIRPLYAPIDVDHVALVERITGIYRDGVGNKKGELIERLKEVENESQDFKLVRGLSMLLERRSTFEAEAALDPIVARKAVFREASRTRASNPEERARVLQGVSAELGTSSEALERTLFSDVEEELIMRDFQPFPSADALLRYYNLSLTQTLLFKSLRVEFSASGNWKNIFRDVKRLGLIYSVERGKSGDSTGQFRVTLDGPLSLFKMTERYGTSIAKLLPRITASDSWDVKAEILMRNRGGKMFAFGADSGELKGLLPGRGDAVGGDKPEHVDPLYDSGTEEKFARSFLSYGTGWALRREPEPLVAGAHVLIPDFSFERDGMKVYLEVVGFWTPEYLERKINKLNLITDVDMIIAADETLACSKLERLKGKALVMYYKRDVPLKPIVEHLRRREGSTVSRQVEKLRGGTIELSGDVVEIEGIARQKGVAVASVKMAMKDFKQEGYVRVSDGLFVSTTKLDEIDGKLRGVVMLTEALGIIEASGVKEEGGKVLDLLGYTSVWEGMDMDQVRISRRAIGPASQVGGKT